MYRLAWLYLCPVPPVSFLQHLFIRTGVRGVGLHAYVFLCRRIRRLFSIHFGKPEKSQLQSPIHVRPSTYCSAVVASSQDLSSLRRMNLGNRILSPRSPPRWLDEAVYTGDREISAPRISHTCVRVQRSTFVRTRGTSPTSLGWNHRSGRRPPVSTYVNGSDFRHLSGLPSGGNRTSRSL